MPPKKPGISTNAITRSTRVKQPLERQTLVYGYPPMGLGGWAFFVFSGVVFVVGPLIYAFAAYDYAYTHYGPVAATTWSRGWFTWSTWAALIWTVAFTWRLSLALERVELLAEGIAIHRPFRKTFFWSWGQISGIATANIEETLFRQVIASRLRVTLFTVNAKTISLNPRLMGLVELVTRLKANLYPRLMPTLRVALRDGHWVAFGPLSLHRREGIRLRERFDNEHSIPWAQMRHFSVRDGRLVIESAPRTFQFPVWRIPNLELLLQLIREEISP